MPTSKAYRNLAAWQASMAVVERVYAATKRFPDDERFGLTTQIRRASVSMPANVAEGWSRRSVRSYANHVTIALGSHAEVETCLEISRRLGYVSPSDFGDLMIDLDRAGQLLSGLFRSLDSRPAR
jgi:four helix bundle protein